MGTSPMEYNDITEKLIHAGLRPTRQRILLASLLFAAGTDRHVTAESLHRETRNANFNVSLATVYNTLHQFTDAGLMRELSIEGGRTFFDTNVSPHHHFLCEDGELIDIHEDEIVLARFPVTPVGKRVNRIDVVIRLSAE